MKNYCIKLIIFLLKFVIYYGKVIKFSYKNFYFYTTYLFPLIAFTNFNCLVLTFITIKMFYVQFYYIQSCRKKLSHRRINISQQQNLTWVTNRCYYTNKRGWCNIKKVTNNLRLLYIYHCFIWYNKNIVNSVKYLYL